VNRTAVCRPFHAKEREGLRQFLEGGAPADVFLLHHLSLGGVAGFMGLFDGDRPEGVAFTQRGMISLASRTPPELADRFLPALLEPGPWVSVVGAEPPCAALVSALTRGRPARVDRRQTYMVTSDLAGLAEAQEGLRPARISELSRLVTLVARYRVEDRLARPQDDHTQWIRTHVSERVRSGRLFVVEEKRGIVFMGAFTFLGSAGAGLGGIYTVPAARGRGIAARATADLCRIGLEAGPWVTLHAAADNQAAIRCYEKAGLASHGSVRLTFR